MEKTVSEVMVVMRSLRERLNDLKKLREDVAKKERYFGQSEKVVEPQYDVKAVDRRIVSLQNALMTADAAIKASNAKVTVQVNIDFESLMAPLT